MEFELKWALAGLAGLIAIVILVSVFMPGLIFDFSLTKPFKDCGEDVECFSQLMEDCSPGKVTVISPGMTWGMESKGEEDGLCHTVFSVEDISLSAPQLIIYPDELKERALAFEGKSMVCLLPLGTDEAIIPEESMDFCEGELKGVLAEVGEAFNDYQARLILTNEDCIPGYLWDTDNSYYRNYGIYDVNGTDYCKTEYAFFIENRLSMVTFTHYSGFLDEFVEVSFPKNVTPPNDFFNEWCESSSEWTDTAVGGAAKVLNVEAMGYDGVPTCKFTVLIQPISELLPSATVDVYSLQDGRTAILSSTNQYNSFQFTFEQSAG